LSLTNTPGAAAAITATATSLPSATVGYAFATPLQVLVTDAYGNAVPGVSVTYSAPATGGPSARAEGGAAVTTNAQGFASPTFLANTVAGGPYNVTATVGGLLGSPASFSLTNAPGVAKTFVVSGFPSPTTAGFAHSFIVTALDQYGNLATGYGGTVAFASTDPQAGLPASGPLTGGTGTFIATLKTAGTQSLTATDSLMIGLTGTQAAITVNPGAATTVHFLAPSTASPNVSLSFILTALDSFGNIATGYTGTIEFSSSDKKAVLPGYATLPGGTGTFAAAFSSGSRNTNQTLTATDVALPSLTATVTIFVDPPVGEKSRAIERRLAGRKLHGRLAQHRPALDLVRR
jgi:hypothetical protein